MIDDQLEVKMGFSEGVPSAKGHARAGLKKSFTSRSGEAWMRSLHWRQTRWALTRVLLSTSRRMQVSTSGIRRALWGSAILSMFN
jgi:hypothetical protein